MSITTGTMNFLDVSLALGAVGLATWASVRLRAWFVLWRAKHPSLKGHPRMALRLARLMPGYAFSSEEFLRSDGAPAAVLEQRSRGFQSLSEQLRERAPKTLELSAEVEDEVSDVAFTNAYRVPFPFREQIRTQLPVGCFVEESRGVQVRDLDGNWSYDLAGAYGMNLFGYDFYKECIQRAVERAGSLGPYLGAYHPVLADNVRRLREISGMDEVSFHMSGTEAVMQAVRLACYHTKRTHVVRFCGAYHGWWDGVQPGPGNPRVAREVYTLRDMDERSLRVLRSRKDIACVLVNPLQAMHPNSGAPGDSLLVSSTRTARYDRASYSAWLRRLREVCTERGIALIFDEVFLGFRLARGGAQEYFGVRADLVTYGKTLGGGLPVGVLCGKHGWMKRYRDERPSDVCFARGTFNSHPYVMAAMNEFLRALDRPQLRSTYDRLDEVWNSRAEELNARLASRELPVRVANMTSVWTVLYTRPGRFHWMLQYYLRAQGLALSWIGTGRLIFSHNYTDRDFDAVADRFLAAASAMRDDGWWWEDPALTNASIRRRIRSELIGAVLRRAKRTSPPEPTPHRPAARAIPSPGSSR